MRRSIINWGLSLFIIAMTLTPAHADIKDGLVGRWTLDETSSNTAADTSGSNNALTITPSSSWVEGNTGNALSFNGSTQYAQIDKQLISAFPFTLSGWVKATNANTIGGTIASLEDSTANTPYYYIYIGTDGKAGMTARYNAGNEGAVSGGTDLRGSWHYVVGVYSSATDRKLYVDGVQVGSSITSYLYNTSINRFSVGRLGRLNDKLYFNGSIDDVRLYNKALSDVDIQEIYKQGGSVTVEDTTPVYEDPIGPACTPDTYYVDFKSGDDSNDGACPDTAWKHAPGDVNATGKAASTVLQAGKTVRFKGGESYVGMVQVKWSGSAGNPIVYDGNNDGSWGSGRAIITNNNSSVNAYGFKSVGTIGHITIQGFDFYDIGGYADNDPSLDSLVSQNKVISAPIGGFGVSFNQGSNLIFRNNNFHEIGQWLNRLPFSGINSITGTAIDLSGVTDVLIDGCDITRTRVGISVKASSAGSVSDVEIKNCDIHNYIVWGIDIAPRSALGPNILKNISIHDNKIHDYAEYDLGNWKGAGEKPHTDGIFVRSAGMPATWENINIYNNAFYNLTPENSAGGTAAVYISQGPNVKIYNNLFYQVRHSRTIGAFQNGDNPSQHQKVEIYNNVFYNTPAINLDLGLDPAKSAYIIKNNIFYNSSTTKNMVQVYAPVGVSPILDNNLYYSPVYSTNDDMIVSLPVGSYMTFNTLRSKGFELSGVSANPKFVNPAGFDFRIQSDSSAINVGENLSSTGFSTDLSGMSRSEDSAWDIGAYEYQTNIPGDVSNDKKVTMYDAALVLRFTLGSNLTDTQKTAADINADGKVDGTDVVAIAKKGLGL